jgi:spermidine/putrescine transport system ATP-binding protein
MPSARSTTGDEPAVTLQGVSRRFGDVVALDGVTLDVHPGEFMSILGPSGCGKTTLLRIVGGFEVPDEGTVLINGASMARVPPHRRPANTVFQRYALFPHMTVHENVAFGLSLSRRPKAEIRAKVEAMLRLVRLEGFGERLPSQLSGGQAQRVALARALANDPVVLLLDEPLAALDLKLRQAMHVELRQIQREVGSTFLYVTHDQEEALSMSDRITLMNGGRIEQIGTPLDVYRRPASRFVSGFIGEANVFEGVVAQLRASEPEGTRIVVVEVGSTPIEAESDLDVRRGDRVALCVRPESIAVRASEAGAAPPGPNRLGGRIQSVVFLGPAVRYLVDVPGHEAITVQADASHGEAFLAAGEPVVLSWPSAAGALIGA